MKMMKTAIEKGNIGEVSALLKAQPSRANAALSFGPGDQHSLHPLNFICDCVFEHKIEEATALALVQLFLGQGSAINGNTQLTKDTPLIAASSLHCEEIAVFLIDQGADIHARGTHGGTALHWACWTGADKVVQRLLREDVDLEDAGNEFHCTPLLWAVHGLKSAQAVNHRNQFAVIAHLLEAGANPHATFQDGQKATDVLHPEEDARVRALLMR